MLRKLLGVGVLLTTLAGCTDLKECDSDDDCAPNGLCNIELKLCYAAGTEPELDGGVCTPACAEYEACTRNGCRARFSDLSIESPAANALLDAGPVQVTAKLTVNETYRPTTRFPNLLSFHADLSDGGSGGTFGTFSHDDAGTYNAVWTPAPVEAQVTLSVAHPAPDAGLSDTRTVRVDAVAPVFNVAVPPASTSVSDGGTIYADPDAGSLTNLWLRDQQVPVEVRTNEANLDPSSLKVALKGTDGVAGTPVAVTPMTTGCDAGFCGTALVNLWEPTFDAFRAPMVLDVQGRDLAGNVGTSSPAIPQVNVTRWRWAYTGLSGSITGSPAIGDKGTVYVGTADGKVVAVNPDGTKAWDVAAVGPVASLSVGALDGGVEFVYAAANTSTNNRAVLYALSSDDGGVRVRCPGTGEHDGPVQSSMVVTKTGATPLESGVAIVNNGATSQLWAVRPEASSTGQCQISNSNIAIPETSPDSTVVVNGNGFIYPTGATSIVGYTYGSATIDWTATGTQQINGLAFSGGKIVGGGGSTATQGGLYTVPASGDVAVSLLPNTNGGRVWNPIIGGANGATVLYGQDTSSTQGNLKRYDLVGQTVPASVSNTGVLKYAPSLGADGVLYTAPSSSNQVSAWSSTDFSAMRWSVTLNAAATAAVGLDCARTPTGAVAASKPGTLYVPSGGVLNAIIVDSPGLSRDTAAWPKYQHDARNTGNSATTGPNCQ